MSTDGGDSWNDAELENDLGSPWAWQLDDPWSPTAGEYELCCRAGDAAGNELPLEPSWNLGGYVNNAVQRIPVTVDGG